MKYSFLVLSFLFFLFFSHAQVTIQANFPKVIAPNSEFAFDVKIIKGQVSNFAKYQIEVPEGITLSEVETKTGSFSFENNRGKIIWVALPSEAEFDVIFRLTSGQVSGSATVNQKFTFLENGVKKEVEAPPIAVTFSATGKPPVPNNPLSIPSSTLANVITLPPSSPTPVSSHEASAPARQEEPVKVDPPKPREDKESSDQSIAKLQEQFKAVNDTKPAAVASGVVYRIQIGAYGDNPGKVKYKALPDVAITKEGDFYKVLVGNFKNKEEAVGRKAELLEKGFKGFVVAYENGIRIK